MKVIDLNRKINNETYIVKVPIVAAMSEYDMEYVGLITNETKDGSTTVNANEFTVVGKTIYEMAMIHSNGFPIYLVNPDDKRFIYDILDAYVHNANQRSAYSPNVVYNTSKEEDLIMLDRFASEIYDIHKEGFYKQDKENMKNENNLMSKGQNLFMDKFKYRNEDDESALIRQSYRPNQAINITDLLNS
jgi:hypothetical protein